MNIIEQAKFPVRIENPDLGSYFKRVKNDYQAIIRDDTNELIDIHRPTYNLIRNEKVLNNTTEALKQADIPYTIGGESFVSNRRMRIQLITDIKMLGGDNESVFVIYVSNSYDATCSVRFDYGIVRLVCTNGLVSGQLNSYSAKHTKGLEIDKLTDKITNCIDNIDRIPERIQSLSKEKVDSSDVEYAKDNYTKKMNDYLELPEEKPYNIQYIYQNRMELLNESTYFISHFMEKRTMERYQRKVAKQFQI